jgi:glycosyltransferase involved in cell wall biosynthesis
MNRLRVLVLGLRGLPDVEGGVERHAEHLYPLIVELGCHVEVLVRAPYHPRSKPLEHRGVRLKRLWSPEGGPLEALLHTLLGTLYAGIVRPDVLHIHAIGPSLLTPLARLLGLRVVVTHHGADYEREKWGRLARWVLRVGERMGMRFSNERIAISKTIQTSIRARHDRDSALIPNGVGIPEIPNTCIKPRELGLVPQRYVLQVSRLVPEKRQLDLIHAFTMAATGWKLALVGGIDRKDEYTREVVRLAEQSPDVVLTGFMQGLDLRELFAHSGVFVLPSSHEGLPIALLESLSFGVPVIASNIPANMELDLPEESYFRLGDIEDLSRRIRQFAEEPSKAERGKQRESLRKWVAERYDWRSIASATLEAYSRASDRRPMS